MSELTGWRGHGQLASCHQPPGPQFPHLWNGRLQPSSNPSVILRILFHASPAPPQKKRERSEWGVQFMCPWTGARSGCSGRKQNLKKQQPTNRVKQTVGFQLVSGVQQSKQVSWNALVIIQMNHFPKVLLGGITAPGNETQKDD